MFTYPNGGLLITDFTVVVIDPIHESGIRVLKKHVNVIQLPPSAKLADLLEVSDKADAFITRGFIRIPKDVFLTAKRLKVIGVHGVGVDHIDIDLAKEKRIQLVGTPTALTDTVAEFTVGLMLALLRKIPNADAAVRNGEWKRKYTDLVGADLKGKTVGLIGLGRIGGAVAKRLITFDTRLIYCDEIRNPELEQQLGIECIPLNGLLGASDIISIHVPLTPATFHMISGNELGMMKPTAYIVNTSRGAVIDEKALCEALESGRIAGAALDVFESEPITTDGPLAKLKEVILTPHLAASSKETLERMAVTIAEEVIRRLGIQT